MRGKGRGEVLRYAHHRTAASRMLPWNLHVRGCHGSTTANHIVMIESTCQQVHLVVQASTTSRREVRRHA